MANSALPTTYNSDGTVIFGCQDTTIATAASNGSPATFSTEGMTLTFDSDWTVQNSSAARPNKQFGRPKVPEADLELQCLTGTSAPYLFSEFTLSTINSVTYTFIVQRTVVALKNDGSASKVTIAARYKLN